MKEKLFIVFLILILPLTKISAQESAPLLTGKVEISITEGSFECDFTLSDIPRIEDYFIRINSGMNILHMRSKKPDDFLIEHQKSLEDSLASGESIAYYFKDSTGKKKYLPETIQFKYVGKYPVITDTIENYSLIDWKGNIAFNHNSVRTDGIQSAWYPYLYDIEKDIRFDRVRYDIEITCKDCSTLYINGNGPITAHSGNFKSNIPRELALFCGNYHFKKLENNYLLNCSLSEEETKNFSRIISSYKEYYAYKLNIPFEQDIAFIQTTPTSRNANIYIAPFPAIMTIDWTGGMSSLFHPEYGAYLRSTMAHELAHYYFNPAKFNSELGFMLYEGFAEYLSLELARDVIHKDLYSIVMNNNKEILKNFKPKEFTSIKSKSDYEDIVLYAYHYVPLILTAIEKEIGNELMWKWINNILTTPAQFTNYDFLRSTLQKTLNDEAKFNLIKKQYFESENSLENAIKKIGMK